MPKYTYTVNREATEEMFIKNAGKTIQEALGDVSFENISLVVVAENKDESENVRKGITDIRMWDLASTED